MALFYREKLNCGRVLDGKAGNKLTQIGEELRLPKIHRIKRKIPNGGMYLVGVLFLALCFMPHFFIRVTSASYSVTAPGTAATRAAAFDVTVTPPAGFSEASITQNTAQSSISYPFVIQNNSEVAVRARAVVTSGQATLSTTGWVAIPINQSATITVTVPATTGIANTVNIDFEYEQLD